MQNQGAERRPSCVSSRENGVESIISELEIRLGLAEDHLDTLNRTVFRQQEQIDLLQAQIRELARTTRSAELEEPRNPADEVPPHY